MFKGAGEGIGHFFGGITGGGSKIVKGVGQTITTVDGKALATGETYLRHPVELHSIDSLLILSF